MGIADELLCAVGDVVVDLLRVGHVDVADGGRQHGEQDVVCLLRVGAVGG